MVVMPDAVIDQTVNGIIGSAFGAAGQRCMAGSVVVTVGEAHERLMPALVEATEQLSVGDGIDEAIDVGPVVSCAARDRITGWIDRAVDDGATLSVDGRAAAGDGPEAPRSSARRSSTTSPPDAPIVAEEVFGPVLTVVKRGLARRGDRDRQRQPLRQRHVDLHGERRRRPPLPPRGRGGHDRRQHRRRRAGRLLPVQRLEGQLPRRPARPRPGRGRVLHAQEDRHEPLLLERPGPRLRTSWQH